MKDALEQHEDEFNGFNFKITKARDLISKIQNEPEPEIIWNGIVEGSKGLIVGVSKTGKTTLAENLAISLAVGRNEFFNYPLKGKPEKVLFINLEESFRVRSRRNLKQISILSEDEKNLFDENYYSTPEDFPEFLVTEDNWNSVNKYIEEVNPKYVFIDSLSHMFEGQIENSEPAIKFVKRFRTYISSLNKTVIIVHHNTKGNDKPIDQDSIAGSRIIAQEFEYAIGLGNIPTNAGGSYLCILYNKYIEKDDSTAYTYKIDSENWVQNIGSANKYDLYNNTKIDYRTDSTNRNRILNFIQNQSSQNSQVTYSADLKKEFVDNDSKTMSKDTLYKSLEKLINEGTIEKVKMGEYIIKKRKEDEREQQ
ncbi:AAA family ATPase [Flavobacterium sp.]|jgi:hypothetical protein|uniref:AAA family ATPase n=1 Tax=Flavobacterium sp. TaxID=239 RepID=UPI0037BFD162